MSGGFYSELSNSGEFMLEDPDMGSDPFGSGSIGDGSGGLTNDSKPAKKKIGAHPYKGVHMDQSITNNPELSHQMATMFESPEFKGILSPFIRGNEHVTFRLGKMGDDDSFMETSYGQGKNIVITINENAVDRTRGFFWSSTGKDTGGFQQDGTSSSLFSTGLAHEAMHAKHMFVGDDAMRICGGDTEKAAEYVSTHYSPELSNVLFKKEGDRWVRRDLGNFGDLDHLYMGKNNQGTFRTVRDQYRR